MLSKIVRFLLPVAAAFAVVTIAKADTETFPFTYITKPTTPSGTDITASGYFSTDGYGDQFGGLSPSDITGWNITFTSPSFLGVKLTLDQSNSSLSIPQNDTYLAANASPKSLLIEALDQNGGFDLSGTDDIGSDHFFVEWKFVDGGPTSDIAITVPGTASIVGANYISSYPAYFNTADTSNVGSSGLSPVPEPSSLLLLGTGSFSLAAVYAGRFKNARR